MCQRDRGVSLTTERGVCTHTHTHTRALWALMSLGTGAGSSNSNGTSNGTSTSASSSKSRVLSVEIKTDAAGQPYIVPIRETLSFDQGFFLSIRAIQVLLLQALTAKCPLLCVCVSVSVLMCACIPPVMP